MIKNGLIGLNSPHKSLSKALKSFPSDLKVFIKDGTVVTTYDRPYFVWTEHDRQRVLLGVIDESAVPADIRDYNSLFLLTRDSLVINQDKVPLQNPVIKLSMFDFTIDRTKATFLGNKIERYFPLLFLFFAFVSVFMVPVFSAGSNLITIFIISVCGHLLFSLYSHNHRFKKSFQFALHSSTLPITVYYMLSFYGAQTSEFRLASYLLLLLFCICALYEGYLEPHHHLKKHASSRKK